MSNSVVSKFLKSKNFVIAIVFILILIGTLGRALNLFNLGSFFDLVVTQYDWGKYQFENGVYGFWRNYEYTFDYMPGAFYLDLFFYSIAHFFGGTDQQFVTVVKLFNWVIDIAWTVLVYFVARSSRRSKRSSLALASLAYAIPSIWVVTGVWGQMDSLVGLMGIIAVYFYYFAEKNVENWPLAQKFYEQHRKRFVLYSAIVLALGYFIKPTVLICIPIIAILVISRKDWKSIFTYFLSFVFLAIPVFFIPLMGSVDKVLHVIGLPFSSPNPSRGAANIWYLLDIGNSTLNPIFQYGTFKFMLGIAAVLLLILLFGYYLAKTFALKSHLNVREILAKVSLRKISFTELNIIFFLLTSIYFIFYISVHTRYYMTGMLVSFLVLATWDMAKKYRILFANILVMHFAFFLNQIWMLSNQKEAIIWVNVVRDAFPLDGIKLCALLYLVCFTVIYCLALERVEKTYKSE